MFPPFKNSLRYSSLIYLFVAGAMHAQSVSQPKWVLENDKNICALTHIDSRGIKLQLAASPSTHKISLLIGNPQWSSIQPGKTYSFAIFADGMRFGPREAVGIRGGRSAQLGIAVNLNQRDVDRVFRERMTVQIQANGVHLAGITTYHDGDYQAWSLLQQCVGKTSDPFAN
jgi:hypothetical protein